jgi:hypothetical protein
MDDMIWQWLVIGALVVLAAIYLARVIRRTIRQPFCSDCPGCTNKKLKPQGDKDENRF